jgi:uncharacterized protein YndB with AHSA1/START domain
MDSTNRVEKHIEQKAPDSRVWTALTDYREFGEWFGVKLENPFVAGQPSLGQITFPGYEHLKMELVVQKVEPERHFYYTWHPYAMDPKVDYSQEPPTLVEFTLEPITGGTLLRVSESGFDRIPSHRRLEAFRKNGEGWAQQMTRIEAYLASSFKEGHAV